MYKHLFDCLGSLSDILHNLEPNYKHTLKSYSYERSLCIRYIVGITHFLCITNESTLMMSYQ